jgi:hypothetical protein
MAAYPITRKETPFRGLVRYRTVPHRTVHRTPKAQILKTSHNP